MSKTLAIRPRLSEKTYGLSEKRVYVFNIPAGANKHAVARAVAAQYEVEVVKVNFAGVAAKPKRTITKGGRRVIRGTQGSAKKAYVTLKEGHSLPIFAAVEEAEEKQDKVQEQVDKAAAKQAQKEAKPARRGLHLPGRRSGARGGDK